MNRKQFLTGVGFGAMGVLPGLAGARTLPSAGAGGTFDVREFGATGDGVTGDSAAIQRAIDAAAKVGGTVFFPLGVYRCHDLKVAPHVRLRAEPVWGYQTVLTGAVLRIDSPDAFALLNLDSAYGAHVSGLHLVGDVSYKKKVYGIWGRSGRPETYEEEDSMFIDECKVELFSGDAIRLDHVEAFWIRHSMIYHNRGDGFHSDGSADGFLVDNVFNGNWGHAICGTESAAAAMMVAENRIEFNHRHGIYVCNTDFWTVIGNTFDDNGHAGICLDRALTTTVTGNAFRYNCRRQDTRLPEYQDVPDDQKGASIVANGCRGCVISSNTVRGWRARRENCADYGLRVKALDACVVKDNVFDRGYVKELLRDEGGHSDSVVIRDNVGTRNVPEGEETRPRILKSFGRKVTAFLFAAAASLAALAGEPFAVFPESCATPDGMAVDPRGRLVIAAPNFADPSKPGVLFRIDRPGEKPYVWVTVPPHPRTGHAVPMGISFGDEGELYVCDNQGRFAAYEGRLLRLTFKDDRLAGCETVAEGMESPNGCEYHDGAIWMTQSTVKLLDQGAGTAASFVYRFGKDERNVRITNSREDVNIVAEIATENRFSHGGANALCFGKDGALYVTHFGDGAILRYELASGGRKLTDERTFAVTDFDYTLDPKAPGFLEKASKAKMRSADGICLGPDGAFYVADFVNNAVCRVSPKGEITVLKQSPDGNGLDGGLNQPSETIFWQGHLVVANFDASCGTPNVNTKSDRPCTLVEVSLCK